MAKRTLTDKRTIVTGASSGIGKELVSQLVQRGNQVLAIARRQDRLEQLQSDLENATGTLTYLAGDITDSEFRRSVLDWIRKNWAGCLDVLINNAGVGSIGPFADSSESTLRQIMEVNFFAAVQWIRDLLPALKKGRSPVVCNVGSVLGHTAMPSKSEYCASKFALHGFSDALRIELSADGIDVVLVSPSTTKSEFFASVLDGACQQNKGMSADRVAASAIKAIAKGKREVILSYGGNCLVLADRLLPTTLSKWLTRWYRRQPQTDMDA